VGLPSGLARAERKVAPEVQHREITIVLAGLGNRSKAMRPGRALTRDQLWSLLRGAKGRVRA
jgi:hypothetical protein